MPHLARLTFSTDFLCAEDSTKTEAGCEAPHDHVQSDSEHQHDTISTRETQNVNRCYKLRWKYEENYRPILTISKTRTNKKGAESYLHGATHWYCYWEQNASEYYASPSRSLKIISQAN